MLLGIAVFLGLIVVGETIFLLLRRQPKSLDDQPKPPDELRDFAEKMISQLSQRIEAIEQRLVEGLRESRQSASEIAKTTYSHVSDFSKGISSLESSLKHLSEKVGEVASFQSLFKTPKTSGKWGEAQLNHILGEYFERNLWEAQHYFKNGEAVDAVIRLPNKKLLPIDSKFNFTTFEKMVNAPTVDYDNFKKDFIRAVRGEIDSIASKYINPGEETTDMAVMFISAESVYYEIVNVIKEEDLISYAWKKKIILTSPNTIYMTLQVLLYWFNQVGFQKNLNDIFGRLEGIKKDALKLQDGFRKLGNHLGDADKVYHEFDHRLTLLTERIQKVIDINKEFKKIESESSEKILE